MFNITIKASVLLSSTSSDELSLPVEFTIDDLKRVVEVVRKSMVENAVPENFFISCIGF